MPQSVLALDQHAAARHTRSLREAGDGGAHRVAAELRQPRGALEAHFATLPVDARRAFVTDLASHLLSADDHIGAAAPDDDAPDQSFFSSPFEDDASSLDQLLSESVRSVPRAELVREETEADDEADRDAASVAADNGDDSIVAAPASRPATVGPS